MKLSSTDAKEAIGLPGAAVAVLLLVFGLPVICGGQLRKAVPTEPVRAMWAWNSRALLESADETNGLIEFCSKTGINRIFLSVDLKLRQSSSPRFEIRSAGGYHNFLERVHQHHLEVEALVGTPEWAARENHVLALAAVDAILEFNKSARRSAGFDGIHFDVEPYLLLGYADTRNAKSLLADFLRMVSFCARRTRAHSGLRFTCDVPAYFYADTGGEAEQFRVNFNGRVKTVGEHLTDLLPLVTIMDYRNRAEGPGGAIASALPAIRCAQSRGRKVLVGLETSSEAERTVQFVCGLPRQEFRRRLEASGLADAFYFEGWRLATFSDDIYVHVGLVAPHDPTEALRAGFQAALMKLAQKFGAASANSTDPSDDAVEIARAALSQDPEWAGFEPFELRDSETSLSFHCFRATLRTAAKTTFHSLGAEIFNQETRSLENALGSYSSYGGLAIHHYESYRELLGVK